MDPNEQLRQLRDYFPVTRRYAYLNHASIAPMATPVKAAVDQVARALLRSGGSQEPGPWDLLSQLKSSLGELMGIAPSSLAITRNTTEGILIAANGLRTPPGANVVIAENEFPANVRPWRGLVGRGFEIRVVPERQGMLHVEDFAGVIDEGTAAVAVSFVEFSTGQRNDLPAIARLAREADALFVVDAIQGLGALRLEPKEIGIDVLAGGAHKWMLAVPGIGFAYFSDRALDRLAVDMPGWTGVLHPEEFGNYDQPLAPGARRFETGSWAVLEAVALGASTRMILDAGPALIEDTVLALADHVRAAAEAGGLDAGPRQPTSARSGIVIIATPWDDPADVAKRLASHRVIVAPRGVGIRVAAHAYNTQEELDLLVELLKDDRDRHQGPARSAPAV
jgi:cysteine desulfurase / selenocysteine lyase